MARPQLRLILAHQSSITVYCKRKENLPLLFTAMIDWGPRKGNARAQNSPRFTHIIIAIFYRYIQMHPWVGMGESVSMLISRSWKRCMTNHILNMYWVQWDLFLGVYSFPRCLLWVMAAFLWFHTKAIPCHRLSDLLKLDEHIVWPDIRQLIMNLNGAIPIALRMASYICRIRLERNFVYLFHTQKVYLFFF